MTYEEKSTSTLNLNGKKYPCRVNLQYGEPIREVKLHKNWITDSEFIDYLAENDMWKELRDLAAVGAKSLSLALKKNKAARNKKTK